MQNSSVDLVTSFQALARNTAALLQCVCLERASKQDLLLQSRPAVMPVSYIQHRPGHAQT
jgi:hypothetical protein